MIIKIMKKEKIKIMAIGDLHGDTSLVKQLAKKATKEKVDIVVLAGDLTFAETSIDNLVGPFAKEKKKILLIPGNHETPETVEFLSRLYSPYTINLHGEAFEHKGVGFFGAGTAHIGRGAIPDSMIFELLKKSHEKIKNLNKKIMVTHMHPRGSKAEFSGFKGSPAIKKAIKQFTPTFAICSHIHEAAGLEETIGKTYVINVSKKPKIFEI